MAGRKGLSTIIATMLNLHGTFDFRTEAYPPPRPYNGAWRVPSVAPCVCGPHTPGSRFRIKITKKPSLQEEEESPECQIFAHSGKLIFPECRTRGRESFSSTTDTRGRETLREVVSTQDPVGYCCADIC
jgi:hypothetical protein